MSNPAFWIGGIIGAVLVGAVPWLIFRRWGWGRGLVIGCHVVLFAGYAVLVLDPNPEVWRPSWPAFLSLPVVMILAKYNRSAAGGDPMRHR